jgi:hypothetical protein
VKTIKDLVNNIMQQEAASGIIVDDRQEILPNLWLGSMPSSVNGFDYVFCVSGRPNYLSFKHLMSPETIVTVAQLEDEDFLPPVRVLHDLADQVLAAKAKGRTLVHCLAGLNRSALIVALAMIKDGWNPDAAILHLRNTRDKNVLFNKTFEAWLLGLKTSA